MCSLHNQLLSFTTHSKPNSLSFPTLKNVSNSAKGIRLSEFFFPSWPLCRNYLCISIPMSPRGVFNTQSSSLLRTRQDINMKKKEKRKKRMSHWAVLKLIKKVSIALFGCSAHLSQIPLKWDFFWSNYPWKSSWQKETDRRKDGYLNDFSQTFTVGGEINKTNIAINTHSISKLYVYYFYIFN